MKLNTFSVSIKSLDKMDTISETHRLKSLIRFLNYTELRKAKVLPQQALFTKVPRGGKFPKIAQKMGYSNFGLLIECIVRESLLFHKEDLLRVFERCREYVPEEFRILYKPQDYVEIGEMVRESESLDIKDFPVFQPQWSSKTDNIIGYPYLVTKECIYDIKTTDKFGSMRTQVLIPQVLSYYALAHINGLSGITSVGVILPAQRLVLKVDLKGWNWKPFWEKVVKCIPFKEKHHLRNSLPVSEYKEFQKMIRRVGYHVEKSSLREMIVSGLPTQFFVGGRVSTKVTSLTEELSLFLKNRFDQPIFIHSPYTINLSNPYGKFHYTKGEGMPWACRALKDILETGEKASLNGVVVHCGKKGKLSQETALKEMYDSLCQVAPYIPESSVCPLLLETSSGQSGELLYDPEEFSEFYLSLPEDVQRKIKICVDSAHLWGAGYEPMDFISVLESKNIPIALVHYNDSKVPKGSKKDRHARIGEGYIGLQSLCKLLAWSIKNNIPCVHE